MINSFQIVAQSITTIHLWPGTVPGETQSKAPDQLSDDNRNQVTRIARVTDPVIDRYEPEGGNLSGIGVIICPGGGYSILAYDLEGTEVAAWLNHLGITAYVLHYRVPDNREGALQDAQRAIRIVRNLNAGKGHAIQKIGIMGFSAGASLSARISTRYSDQLYTPVDQADQLSARPDFTLLIYPAYIDQGLGRTLTPELKVDEQTPPMFIFQTADDVFGNSSLVMAGALRDKKVPVEMHLLPVGGHGYGLRKGSNAGETWPLLAAAWLRNLAPPKS